MDVPHCTRKNNLYQVSAGPGYLVSNKTSISCGTYYHEPESDNHCIVSGEGCAVPSMDNTLPGKGGAVHQIRAILYKLPWVLFKEELKQRLKLASKHRKCANITLHASFGCSVNI